MTRTSICTGWGLLCLLAALSGTREIKHALIAAAVGTAFPVSIALMSWYFDREKWHE